MTADRQISVYDGQRMIGTITERASKDCVAKDASGRALGKFPSIQKAADALSETKGVENSTPSAVSAGEKSGQ